MIIINDADLIWLSIFEIIIVGASDKELRRVRKKLLSLTVEFVLIDCPGQLQIR